MAPKDYVKRAKAPAKKQATRRKSKKQTSAQLPWVKMFLAITLVVLFAFALFQLQSVSVEDANNDDMTEVNQVPKLEDNSSEVSDAIISADESLEQAELPDLPVLGEEEWEYIDSLPDYSVEVDATGPLESDKDFIMQCGSFRTTERAQELKAKIAFQGLESRILTSNGRNGLWYRVVLGPYERKRNAERHRHQLRAGNVNGCKIW